MVEDFMLPREDWSLPPCNTRTDIRQYLEHNHANLVKAKQQPSASQNPRTLPADLKVVRLPTPLHPRSPSPPEFFESLWWKVNDDDRLVRLCSEIKIIRYKETPIAASMLLRALLEASLEYHLRKSGHLAQYRQKTKIPSLSALVNFCSDPKNGVFVEPRVGKQLASFRQTPIKDHLDRIVHNRFGDVTAEVLNLARPYTKPIIEHIVQHVEQYK
jgi:hypothetical protein